MKYFAHLKLFFALFLCLIAGCGLQFRNTAEIPPALRVIYIKTSVPYSAFLADLRQTFASLGLCMRKCPAEAPITLNILNEKFEESRITISATSLLSQYLLSYQVTYQLENANGCLLVPARIITVTRNYTVNANAVLGAGNEIPLLQQDMRREVVYQIVNQLSSGQVVKACRNCQFCD